MGIFRTVGFITKHPLNRGNKLKALSGFLKWQFGTRLLSGSIVHPFTSKSYLVVEKGMTGATQNIYCGLHDFEEMSFLLHFLRPKDLFVDIGANIGSYTVLASAHVGATSISFEPTSSTYQKLLRNIKINNIEGNTALYKLALGPKKGMLKFAVSDTDTTNHAATENDTNTIEVPVETLDDVIGERHPALIKIDVEGFEYEVFMGASNTLNKQSLKAIIIEFGQGGKYGSSDEKLDELLQSLAFKPFNYSPLERKLTQSDSRTGNNLIYLRDVTYVQQRLSSSEKVEIKGISY